MGQHTIKQRKEAVKAKKRNAQTTSNTPAVSANSLSLPAATCVMPVTKDETETLAAVEDQPKPHGRQKKAAEITTLARTTCSSSVLSTTSKSAWVNAKGSIGDVSQAKSPMTASNSNEIPAQLVRKAAAAVQTLLHRIALSNIAEKSGDESSEEQAQDSEDSGENEGEDGNVTDSDEVAEIARPTKTKAERARTSAMRRKAMKDEESEADDDDDGEYNILHSNH